MPVNRGQGQPTRWYQLCFAPISVDSSDDSDTESVVLPPSTPTPTSTWQELSPPQTYRHFPPSPPLPPLPPSPPLPLLPPPPPPFLVGQAWMTLSDIESQHDINQPPNPSEAFVDHSTLGFSSVFEQERPEIDQSDFFLQVPEGVINAIQSVRISELHQREDNLSHCPICMEEFKVGDQACQLPCKHIYRSECILRWLKNSKTCPVCRLQLDGWEGQGCSDSIDGNSLNLELEIPPPQYPTDSWEYFFQPILDSQVTESSAHVSYHSDYDSACDEFGGDSHEDGDIIGSTQSGRGSQVYPSE